METKRFLIVQKNCPFCPAYFPAINQINNRLPTEKRIKIKDITAEEEFDIDSEPISNILLFAGTPSLYIDGIIVEGMSSASYAKEFLKELLKEEFAI